MNTELLAGRVARHMWKKDGEPEVNPGEPTSVGRSWYDSRVKEVIVALADMGITVVKAPTLPAGKIKTNQGATP